MQKTARNPIRRSEWTNRVDGRNRLLCVCVCARGTLRIPLVPNEKTSAFNGVRGDDSLSRNTSRYKFSQNDILARKKRVVSALAHVSAGVRCTLGFGWCMCFCRLSFACIYPHFPYLRFVLMFCVHIHHVVLWRRSHAMAKPYERRIVYTIMPLLMSPEESVKTGSWRERKTWHRNDAMQRKRRTMCFV